MVEKAEPSKIHVQKNRMANESPSKKMWNVGSKNIEELKRSANRYDVLDENEGNEIEDNSLKDRRLEVDKLITEQRQPNDDEIDDWTYDMKEYFKYK
ncbi:hypothetical protein Tco_0137202 [Tanacetum coccineum]